MMTDLIGLALCMAFGITGYLIGCLDGMRERKRSKTNDLLTDWKKGKTK